MRNIRIYFLLALIFCIAWRIEAQNLNIEFEPSKFPDHPKELKQALKNISKGDEFIYLKTKRVRTKGIGRYEEALKYYLEAYNFNPNNALLNYKIGSCYMHTVEKYKAVPYFEKAYRLNKNIKNDLNYLSGQAYQYNYDFDKAILKFTEYQKELSGFEKNAVGTKVEKKINECRYAKELVRSPVNVKISNLGNAINTKYPEYSPIVNANESLMFFTARKPNSTGKGVDIFDGKYYEDIYITYLKNDIWSDPKNPGKPLNTRTHDALVGVSQDGKTLLTYKVSPTDNGDIYISRLKTDKYTKPKRLNKNINTNFHESSATFSPDGNTLYFISDREGGMGGRDIWMSSKNLKGEWGKAINLGPPVNTSYNEEGVFMQADGKSLYFSSQGHNSMGGYDIFKTINENGRWSEPKNLGYPINTPYNDVFFSITMDGRHGFYASAKKEGLGDQDIYEIEFYEIKTKNVIVRGKVLDGNTKLPLAAKVEVIDISVNASVSIINTPLETGDFYTSVPGSRSYLLSAVAPDYQPFRENIPPGQEINKVIYLYPEVKTIAKGMVLDFQTKAPICNALVIVRDFENKIIADSIRSECQKGEYSSKATKGIAYELIANASGYKQYSEIIPLDVNVNKIIYLQKLLPTDLNGFVFDIETKQPVCDAKIIIRDVLLQLDADVLKSECLKGSYHSDIPTGKKYHLKVEADEYEPYSEIIPEDKTVNKIIYLQKSVPISIGMVYDAETQEPVCAEIEILNANNNTIADRLKNDCPSGRFNSKVPKGTSYIINVSSKGYEPYTENIPADKDVNKIIFIRKAIPSKPAEPKGFVYDIDTKEPLCAKVELYDVRDRFTTETVNSDCSTGEYFLTSPRNRAYNLTASTKDYIPAVENIVIGAEINKIIYLKKIQKAIVEGQLFDVTKEKSFVLPEILYDFDRYNLKPQYQDSLNGLINTMRAFPNITIELGSHTDTRGTDAYNEKLSYNRAKSVVDYLIQKGISPDRMIAKGYGKKVPRLLEKTYTVKTCDRPLVFTKGTLINDEYINTFKAVKCEFEAAHQLNRRTEIKVLSENYMPDSKKSAKEVNIEVIKK